MAEKQEEVLEQPVEDTKVEQPKAEEPKKDTGEGLMARPEPKEEETE